MGVNFGSYSIMFSLVSYDMFHRSLREQPNTFSNRGRLYDR